MHLFSLSCGSTKSTTMRKRKGRGEGVEGDVAGPVLLMPCPAVSDSGFACGANICSKFAAGIRRGQCRQPGRGGGSAAAAAEIGAKFTDASKKKKKRRDEIRQKDALPATAATLRRRRRQRWRQPLLNSAVHKIYDLLLVSGRGRAAGTGTSPGRGGGRRGTGRERIAPAFSINSSP